MGGGPLEGIDEEDGFLAVLNSQGEHIWSKGLSGSGETRINAMDANASDKIAITGLFCGEIDFGGGTHTGNSDANMFLAMFDSVGDHLWSVTFNAAEGRNLAVDSSGNVYFSGVLPGDNFGWADIDGCE